MKRCIFARYTDTSDPDDQHFYRGSCQPTGHQRYVSSNLEWVKELPEIVRLDISCNYLQTVDLSPLAECQNLKYLDLSENVIDTIDLTPLRSCKRLETLDLSYNSLEDVNLTPLIECEKLRYLYLHRNKLDTINIAPLNHLRKIEKVIIDTMKQRKPVPVYKAVFPAPPPNLNDVLYAMTFKTARPEWLEGCPDIKIIRMKPDSYETHVNKHGWSSVKKHLQTAKDLVPKHRDFEAQKAILSNLGIPELACYDGSIADIVELIPSSGTYEDGMLEIQTGLISLLTRQLEQGGSTLFFDIDELATTPGSVLVPLIRSEEHTSELQSQQ